MRHSIASILACATAACGEFGTSSSQEGCDYETREVGLDAKFGEETPRAAIERLERPVSGRVEWFAEEDEHIAVAGASGVSEYSARAIAGPTVRVQEGIEGKGGVVEKRLYCPTTLFFDVEVFIETLDGALSDTLHGTAEHHVSGSLRGDANISVRLDAPTRFAGTLELTEQPGVWEQWETHELVIRMAFSSGSDFVGMNGHIFYNLENVVGKGEIVGASQAIAEFTWPEQ